MKPVFFNKRARTRGRSTLPAQQRGNVLLEALVGTALLGIVGLGMAMVAARTLQSQGMASAQSAVVQQMRHAIQDQGIEQLCDAAQVPVTLMQPGEGSQPAMERKIPLQVQCADIRDVQVKVIGNQAFNAHLTQLSHVAPRIELRTGSQDAVADRLLGQGAIRITQ